MRGKGRNVFYKVLIVSAFALLIGSVAAICWALGTYFRYQQYLKKLNYTMSGDTAVVQVTDEAGTACTLAPTNRYALYSFLTDSTGKRVKRADAALTGRGISFTTESILGSASGTVSETDSDYVKVTLSADGKHWCYYFVNRAGYDYYVKATAPEGWTEPNSVE